MPDGTTSGISRKLPDTERSRLKSLLKDIVPDTAGVIVRTAAEGASEEELTQDVERLKDRWESIEAKSKSGGSPKLLYGEPDLTLKVVRDLFTEDFSKLVIEARTPRRPSRATSPRWPPTSRTVSSATSRRTAATRSRPIASTSRSPRALTARCGCPPAGR